MAAQSSTPSDAVAAAAMLVKKRKTIEEMDENDDNENDDNGNDNGNGSNEKKVATTAKVHRIEINEDVFSPELLKEYYRMIFTFLFSPNHVVILLHFFLSMFVSLQCPCRCRTERWFPYQLMFQWLSYHKVESESSIAQQQEKRNLHREWSITLPGDIYLRHLSFPNHVRYCTSCLYILYGGVM
jgi:hypothetical protein